MPRVTPLRIWRPSRLAFRSRISKSANSRVLLLHFISAVIAVLGHPRGACDLGPEESLSHLLLVQAGEAPAARHVLDGADTVAGTCALFCPLSPPRPVATLGRRLCS